MHRRFCRDGGNWAGVTDWLFGCPLCIRNRHQLAASVRTIASVELCFSYWFDFRHVMGNARCCVAESVADIFGGTAVFYCKELLATLLGPGDRCWFGPNSIGRCDNRSMYGTCVVTSLKPKFEEVSLDLEGRRKPPQMANSLLAPHALKRTGARAIRLRAPKFCQEHSEAGTPLPML